MMPAEVFEDLYAESLLFKVVLWAAIIVSACAAIQWGLAGNQATGAGPVSPITVSATYTSPYAAAAMPVPALAPAITPAPIVLAPIPRPELSDLRPPESSDAGPGLRPKRRPELDGVVIADPKRGLAPKVRPELGDQP